MCLLVVAYKVHPDVPLVLAANRDEFLQRPSLRAGFWPDEPHLLAGRDLKAGGTWLGLSTLGRVAALTNYRDLSRKDPPDAPSRGKLVVDALRGDRMLAPDEAYAGFNLLHGSVDALRYASNVSGTDVPLAPGIHGLSNHLLNTPWFKVRKARNLMRQAMERHVPDLDALRGMLADEERAPRELLPDTGLDEVAEHALSAIRVRLPGYGTVCSTIITVSKDGAATFEEWSPGGETMRFELQL